MRFWLCQGVGNIMSGSDYVTGGKFNALRRYDTDGDADHFSSKDFLNLSDWDKETFIQKFLEAGGRFADLCKLEKEGNEEYYTALANTLISEYGTIGSGVLTDAVNGIWKEDGSNRGNFVFILSRANAGNISEEGLHDMMSQLLKSNPANGTSKFYLLNGLFALTGSNPDMANKVKAAVEYIYMDEWANGRSAIKDIISRLSEQNPANELLKELNDNITKFNSYPQSIQSIIEEYGAVGTDSLFTLSADEIAAITDPSERVSIFNEILKGMAPIPAQGYGMTNEAYSRIETAAETRITESIEFMTEAIQNGLFNNLSPEKIDQISTALVQKFIALVGNSENNENLIKSFFDTISNLPNSDTILGVIRQDFYDKTINGSYSVESEPDSDGNRTTQWIKYAPTIDAIRNIKVGDGRTVGALLDMYPGIPADASFPSSPAAAVEAADQTEPATAPAATTPGVVAPGASQKYTSSINWAEAFQKTENNFDFSFFVDAGITSELLDTTKSNIAKLLGITNINLDQGKAVVSAFGGVLTKLSDIETRINALGSTLTIDAKVLADLQEEINTAVLGLKAAFIQDLVDHGVSSSTAKFLFDTAYAYFNLALKGGDARSIYDDGKGSLAERFCKIFNGIIENELGQFHKVITGGAAAGSNREYVTDVRTAVRTGGEIAFHSSVTPSQIELLKSIDLKAEFYLGWVAKTGVTFDGNKIISTDGTKTIEIDLTLLLEKMNEERSEEEKITLTETNWAELLMELRKEENGGVPYLVRGAQGDELNVRAAPAGDAAVDNLFSNVAATTVGSFLEADVEDQLQQGVAILNGLITGNEEYAGYEFSVVGDSITLITATDNSNYDPVIELFSEFPGLIDGETGQVSLEKLVEAISKQNE